MNGPATLAEALGRPLAADELSRCERYLELLLEWNQAMNLVGETAPETAKDKPKTGIVQAVGTGALNTDTGERIPLSLKKGDRVIFSSYAGTEVKLDKDTLLIMSEDDILAVVED